MLLVCISLLHYVTNKNTNLSVFNLSLLKLLDFLLFICCETVQLYEYGLFYLGRKDSGIAVRGKCIVGVKVMWNAVTKV